MYIPSFCLQDNLGYVGGFGDLPLARAVLLGEAHGSKGKRLKTYTLDLKWVCLKLSPENMDILGFYILNIIKLYMPNLLKCRNYASFHEFEGEINGLRFADVHIFVQTLQRL